jgi:radical SAM superfamily enzyme YgiQ (UPF0313 family)
VSALRGRGLQTHLTVGNHLTTLHDKALRTDFPQFDSAVRGEGERTVVELAQHLSRDEELHDVKGLTYRHGNEIRRNPPRPNIEDLDALPFPARAPFLSSWQPAMRR